MQDLLDELRPDVVALVDSFDLPDATLNSTLGRSDGLVYEALIDAARRSRLNRTVPFGGYQTVLKPHLDAEFLSARGHAHAVLVDHFKQLEEEEEEEEEEVTSKSKL